jgi:hypothetical protein
VQAIDSTTARELVYLMLGVRDVDLALGTVSRHAYSGIYRCRLRSRRDEQSEYDRARNSERPSLKDHETVRISLAASSRVRKPMVADLVTTHQSILPASFSSVSTPAPVLATFAVQP